MIDALQSRTTRARDGIRLHLEGTGKPTALMIHGLGYASWEASILRRSFEDDFGLWSLDNRGTGLSDQFEGECSIDQLADDAADAVGTLGARLMVIGHSMGGYVALTLAKRYPELVRSLVLISTSPGGPGSLPVPPSTRRAWMDAAGSDPAEYARRTMPLSFQRGWTDAHPAEFEQILSARLAHPTPPDVWRKQFDAAESYFATGVDPKTIGVPALVIHGSGDNVVPVENGRLLADLMPNVIYNEVESAGHLVHLEYPQTISQLITSFTTQTNP